jgi:NADH dehydrogenase FAD-containing subunit
MKRLVLLGGGHAHVHVLREMANQPLAGAEVLLVTPFLRQFYSGMLPGLVAGHYTADDCAIPLAPLAQAAGVPLVAQRAVGIDAAARRLQLADGRTVDYDVLSVDTGAVIHRDVLPGAREHGLFVRPIEHFVSLLDGLFGLAGQRVLDVVVIGGGAAGVELAMALQHRLGGHGPADERVRVALVTGGAPPLAGYPEAVLRRTARALKARRIGCRPAGWRSTRAASSPPAPPCRAPRTPRCSRWATWPRAWTRRMPRAASTPCVPARRW